MSLRDYVEKEVRFFIECTHCNDHQSNIYGGTATQAARAFKVEGWIETETDIICPNCVKNCG
jgi:hypothetical protein